MTLDQTKPDQTELDKNMRRRRLGLLNPLITHQNEAEESGKDSALFAQSHLSLEAYTALQYSIV